jgi:flagellar basal-body rod modification protein FlgD
MTSTVPATLLERANAAGTPAAGLVPPGQAIDQQEFLTLFLAQLQHQDPLSPLQPEQLTAQLAQFSSLEQLTGINTRLDTLTGASRQTTTSAMLGLIGTQVRFDGGALTVRGGEAPAVTYRLEDAAQKVTATVRAADGTVVRVVDLGPVPAGAHEFRFDGRDAAATPLADGTYRLTITTTAPGAAEGTPVPLVSTALVDGVDLASDPPALLVGGERVTLDRVREVRAADADA